MTASQSFLGSRDLESVEESWPGVLQNVPSFGPVRCASHDGTGVMGFWKEHHGGEVPFSSHLIGGTRHSRGTTGDVNLDFIIKVVFARSLSPAKEKS